MSYGDVPPLLADEPAGLTPLHQRQYQVQAWRIDDARVLLRGAVEDRKPALIWPGPDESIAIHHMVVDLTISYPELVIDGAAVRFETHPHDECPRIADHYGGLVGLSIARGFTQRVRDLFGGPRGCTHTTALLQAMAPVAVQCGWSMRQLAAGGDPAPRQLGEQTGLRNTCHMWAEDGDLWARAASGQPIPLPIPVRRRLSLAGVDPEEWER